jgi:ABC-type transporter lipoprotein component MlaA
MMKKGEHHVHPFFSLPITVNRYLSVHPEWPGRSDCLLRQSSDPYIMVREAYFQRHDFIANGGKLTPADNKKG